MKLLLDTQALLWFCLDDTRLSEDAASLIADAANGILVSPATYWEIAIKISLGRYAVDGDFAHFFEDQISENRFDVLPITVRHAAEVSRLPFHHRDPFDRLLIAQAIVEQVPIVSCDPAFDKYPVKRIW